MKSNTLISDIDIAIVIEQGHNFEKGFTDYHIGEQKVCSRCLAPHSDLLKPLLTREMCFTVINSADGNSTLLDSRKFFTYQCLKNRFWYSGAFLHHSQRCAQHLAQSHNRFRHFPAIVSRLNEPTSIIGWPYTIYKAGQNVSLRVRQSRTYELQLSMTVHHEKRPTRCPFGHRVLLHARMLITLIYFKYRKGHRVQTVGETFNSQELPEYTAPVSQIPKNND